MLKDFQHCNLEDPSFLPDAPYYSIDVHIHRRHVLDNNILKHTDIADNEHLKIAVSYCDMLVTNDTDLQDTAKDIITKMSLPVSVCGFNPTTLEIIPPKIP